MGFVGTMMGILGFSIGVPLGIFVGFFFLVYHKPKEVEEPILQPLEELDTSTLQNLLPEMPNWLKSPDCERMDWLNNYVLDLWPYLDEAICNTIRGTTKPIFEEYIGKYLIRNIEFEKLSLGTLPPIFHGMKVYETNGSQLVMEPAVKWAGNPNIVLTVSFMSLKLRFQLVDLQVFASPRIHLKPLVPTFPCFSNIVVSLMEEPYVDFGLKVLGGDIMSIPGLYRYVQETIKKQIASLYHWPQCLEIPILDGSTGALKKPVGILHVNVIRAMKLMKKDILGASDPYVTLKLSGEKLHSKRTSIKLKNLNPEWNEKFKLIVKDPETQVLELHIHDWDKVGVHDKLGMKIVPLKDLTPGEAIICTLDLVKNTNMNDPQNKKSRGQLVVELTFHPFKPGGDSVDGSADFSFKESNIELESADAPSYEAGALSIIIIQAECLEAGDHRVNAFVQTMFQGGRRRTKTMKNNRNPRWNEEFLLRMEEPPLDEKLHIEVFNKRRSFGFKKKESLGFVEITLADVIKNRRINEKYHLINSKNGIIHVELQWQAT